MSARTHGCFFFNDTATTEIYTLSLHDALPISPSWWRNSSQSRGRSTSIVSCPDGSTRSRTTSSSAGGRSSTGTSRSRARSEEHTSELQSRQYLVCRLLLEKKKDALCDRVTPLP